jgi:MULE transposase domain
LSELTGTAPTYESSVLISALKAHGTSSIPTLPPYDISESTTLLPPFELQAKKSISAPLLSKTTALSIFSPTRKATKRHHKSLDKNPGSPTISPLPKRKALTSKMGLTSPDSPPEIIFVMSSPATPTRKPITKRSAVDISPMKDSDSDDNIVLHTRAIKQEKMVIDLCTPEKIVRKAGVMINKHITQEVNLWSPGNPMLMDQGVKPESPPAKSVKASRGAVDIFSVYQSVDEAEAAIYAREEALGYHWRRAQVEKDKYGQLKKRTFRCNCYYHHTPTHAAGIDPSDHRQGKMIKTGCKAHVNVNRKGSQWVITLATWDHNHPHQIPEGAPIRRQPTKVQKEIISKLAISSSSRFTRGQLATVMTTQTGTALEPRQIGNIMGQARREARQEVESLGGSMHAVITKLEELARETHGWLSHIKINKDGVVTGVWWQSPLQRDLSRHYGDVLINDNTYSRNEAGYPLNIGIIVDGHNRSRNAWYAFQALEDHAHHAWVLQCHLDSAGYAPETFISDRHRSLISAAEEVLVVSEHIFCMQHLDGNVDKNLRKAIPSDQWMAFKNNFWAVYRAISPEDFDIQWRQLTTRYPAAQKYLDEELYPCRRQWAWVYVSHKFTCGVRTNGRVEVENRITKAFGGPKKSLKDLFDGLNERTNGQSLQETLRVRDVSVNFYKRPLFKCVLTSLWQSSRRQHAKPIETVFPGPLQLVRQFTAPFPLQKCYEQMEQSMYYRTRVLQRPDGIRDWVRGPYYCLAKYYNRIHKIRMSMR